MNAVAIKYGINQDVLDNLEYYKNEGSIKEVYISDTNGSKLPGIFLYCELGNVDKYCNYMEYDFDSNLEAFITVLSCSIVIMNTSMKQIYVATTKDIPNKIITRIERLI